MISTTTNWIEAAEAVESATTILVVTHMSPDGDAIGSLLATVNALRERGKHVDAAVDGGVPDFLHFISGADTVMAGVADGRWDLMISVDASDEIRTGQVGEYGRANSPLVINVDHHATNIMFGQIHLVDPGAVSATEVLFNWFQAVNWAITKDVAVPLLTGLVTDTLGFRTSNVSARTLGIAQRLMEAGASLTEITARTLDNKSYPVVNLWKHALLSVDLHAGGILTAEVTQADLKRSGLTDVTDGGLVQFLIRVDEAMIAAVFKETPEGRTELSFRSKPGFDVSAVAFSLGGGGHRQASGATIDGPVIEAKKRVMPLLRNAIRQGKLVIA